MIENGQKYLVTTNEWFVTPNGYQCKSAWGTCYVKTIDQVFNILPVRPSTNWFLQIGDGDKSIIVAGCHVHYCIRSDERPVEIADTYFNRDTQINTPINNIYFTE